MTDPKFKLVSASNQTLGEFGPVGTESIGAFQESRTAAVKALRNSAGARGGTLSVDLPAGRSSWPFAMLLEPIEAQERAASEAKAAAERAASESMNTAPVAEEDSPDGE